MWIKCLQFIERTPKTGGWVGWFAGRGAAKLLPLIEFVPKIRSVSQLAKSERAKVGRIFSVILAFSAQILALSDRKRHFKGSFWDTVSKELWWQWEQSTKSRSQCKSWQLENCVDFCRNFTIFPNFFDAWPTILATTFDSWFPRASISIPTLTYCGKLLNIKAFVIFIWSRAKNPNFVLGVIF